MRYMVKRGTKTSEESDSDEFCEARVQVNKVRDFFNVRRSNTIFAEE